jgi:hypothetical protein
MKTFNQFISEAQDPRRKAFDNLPSEPANPPRKQPSLLDTVKQKIRQGVEVTQGKVNSLTQPIKDKLGLPGARSYILQDLDRRKPNSIRMPGSPKRLGQDPTTVDTSKSKMPILQGRHSNPKYYDA